MRLVHRTHDPFAEWLPFRAFLREFPEHVHLPEDLADEGGLRVDEYTEDGTLVIRAEVPGIDPDKDVVLEITDGRLTIRADRKQEEEREDRNYYRREMHYGAFARSLPLPPGTDESELTATYGDGILEVRVPVRKPGEAGPKTTIPVNRSD
jgi:HSP20 family protein